MRHKYTVTPRFFTAAFITLLAVSCICLWVVYGFYRDSAAQKEELDWQRSALTEQTARLRDDIAFAQTDEYIMRAARSRLGMIREGEVSYVSGH